MKNLITVSLFTFLCQFAIAQSNWVLISNQGGENIQFVSDTVGFGLEHRTIDGGNNWLPMANSGVRAFYFNDAQQGHIVFNTFGAGDTYWKSTDGGANWVNKSANFPSVFGANDINFFDGAKGAAVLSDSIMITQDGGDTWSKSLIVPGINAYCVELPTDSTIFIGGTSASVWDFAFSKNGGQTWNSSNIGFQTFGTYFTKVKNPRDSVLVAINSLDILGEIVKSTDYGATWQSITILPNSSTVMDIDFPTADTGYVCGRTYTTTDDIGLVYQTSDGGDSWVPMNTGYQGMLYSISFINGHTGWANGDNGDILFYYNPTGISSVEEPVLKDEWKIWPVPATDRINLSVSNSTASDSYVLLSMNGSVVRTGSVAQRASIDVIDIPRGV